MLNEDFFYMREALKEAEGAFRQGEVPVGAVLVRSGMIIARGRNQVELLCDATAHAEMIAITAGAAALENWRLLDTTLYSTLEPCPMCAGAMFASRIKRLVWGAPDLRLGAHGSWVDLFRLPHPMHTVEVTARVLEEESAFLLKRFFSERRGKNSEIFE